MSRRFYYAKLDFNAQVTSVTDATGVGGKAKTQQTLDEFFNADDLVIESGGAEWRFGATRDHNNEFVVGNFGKLFEDEPTTYDESRGKFVTEDAEQVAEASMFLAHYAMNFIVFTQRQRIGYNQFVEAFSKGYNEWSGVPEALTLPFITPTDELERIIDQTKVRVLNFDLEPTNPFPQDGMQELDEEIKNMKAEEVELDAEADGGLNPENELLQSALAFAETKYGDVKVVYEENNETHEFNTKSVPASTRISEPSNLEDLIAKSRPLINRAEQLLE
ncbi:hypothetical protein BRD04_09790 [Halobacteriales archaeon QS_9_67_17]|nr:MAG: hypothetical protein BRD04_09790 [Halobacteriales archaeon QS_9_67_17]